MTVLDCEFVVASPGCQAPPLVVLALGDRPYDDPALISWRDAEAVARVLLEEEDGPLIGHYIAGDMAVLAANFPRLLAPIFRAYEADRIEDTGIRQKLIDIANGERKFYRVRGAARKSGYGLDDLAERLLGIQLAKGDDTWRKRYHELLEVPIAAWPLDAREYARNDIRVTGGVYDYQEANGRQWLKDQHRQARFSFVLKLMSAWGLRTDPEAVRRFEEATRRDYERLARDLEAIGLKRPGHVLKSGKNKGDIKEGARNQEAARQRCAKAYAELGLEVPRTDSGLVALDDATCKASMDPALIAYAEFSSLKNVLSMTVKLLRGGVVTPIHARFDELLETGRTSASPNIQNLRRRHGTRECFVPRTGRVYAAVDFSQMELRTLAQVCLAALGRSKLAQVLNAGRDPHLEVAAVILDLSYEEAERRYLAGDADVKQARDCAKVANFGFPGGLGIDSLIHFAAVAHKVKLTKPKAKLLKEQWFGAYPEMPAYFAWINDQLEAPFPRAEQYLSGRYRGGVSYCKLCNTYFQGLAADAAKSSGWLLARAMYVDEASPLFGSRLVNFIHDEYIAEVPEPTAHECAQEMARLMVEGARPWLPDVPPVVGKPVLMRRWSKKATPVYEFGDDGRLLPWDVAA